MAITEIAFYNADGFLVPVSGHHKLMVFTKHAMETVFHYAPEAVRKGAVEVLIGDKLYQLGDTWKLTKKY